MSQASGGEDLNSADAATNREPAGRRLSELAALFLKLGTIGFGGPAVHIATMEEEVVRRRRWLSPSHFVDLVGAHGWVG